MKSYDYKKLYQTFPDISEYTGPCPIQQKKFKELKEYVEKLKEKEEKIRRSNLLKRYKQWIDEIDSSES